MRRLGPNILILKLLPLEDVPGTMTLLGIKTGFGLNRLAALFLLAVLSGSSFAAGVSTTTGPYSECPAWATDCFNCGAPPRSVACARTCSGELCTCGYDWCECYCPWSGTRPEEPPPQQIDLCAGVSCPSLCSGGTRYYGGECNPSSGDCEYYYDGCDYGCDGNACAAAPEQNPCETFFETHPREMCHEGIHYYDCYCDPSTGDAVCSNEGCNGGCDDAGLRCRQDRCSGTSCQDRCETPGNDFQSIQRNGACNPNTGECEYRENTVCSVGCSMVGGRPSCMEDCDNGMDDDGDGLADCADAECSTSPYCSCERIGGATGSIGGRPLVILIGGYSFPDTTFFYNYKNRDEDVRSDANRIVSALRSTSPFNEMSFEVYATRLPQGVFTGPWRSDLLSKCSGKGGDFTLFLNYKDSKSLSNSKLFSMSATVYRGTGTPSTQDLELTALHEMGHGFAGLWDEYTIASDVGLATGTLAVIRDAGFSKRANCAIAPDVASCQQYFSAFGVSYTCVRGCSAGAWYRPSQESIMNNVYSSSEFNEVSKKIIRDRIRAFSNPPLPRTAASWGNWAHGRNPEALR